MSQTKDKMSEIDEHILKRFDIQKRLGKGAYGIVWKAIDRKTKEIVAIKKIFDAFRNQTDAQRTFREIMFLRSFKDHPNIVRLHSIHRASNNKDIYLGFEYMETDLHNVIKRGNILKDIHKRYIMYQLLKATKYIHSGNVIHRDQKPSNVLLDSLCRCKIADFGLARSLTQVADDNSCDTDPTLTDYVATRWYRAPEILIANRKYTKGIDMWSLGCILGEMLLGKPLFPGTSTFNQVEKIMGSIPSPSADDISQVCVTGLGPSMIRNAATIQKVPLKTLLGHNVAEDALDLVNKLLVFNPYKRLTATQALKHTYVSRFHNTVEEIEMKANVLPPLNDDIRLSIDDYRNKLYEMMTNGHRHSVTCGQKPMRAIHPRGPIRTRAQKEVKEKTCQSQSEVKVYGKSRTPVYTRSEARIVQKGQIEENKSGGEYRKHVRSSNDITVAHPKSRKRSMGGCKSNVCMSAFNSFGSHGIITQSALMELKAAGIR